MGRQEKVKNSTVSVVLATYNEEKTLRECLESVKGLADEIVIVDGTSTDKTVDIAGEFGAKVLVTTNPPIFHINKQKAIDMATKDWILQLDADERVTPALIKEIKEILYHPPSIIHHPVVGYWVPRKNWFLGRFLMKGGVYPDYTLRLYKRGKGKLPMKDVHEQAVVDGEVGFLKEPLIHIADPYFRRYLLRFNRYTSLIAKELGEKKENKNIYAFCKYYFALPLWWFFLVYFRHGGFLDSWQGLIWAFFSALRFPVAFTKYLKGNYAKE